MTLIKLIRKNNCCIRLFLADAQTKINTHTVLSNLLADKVNFTINKIHRHQLNTFTIFDV